MYDAGPFVLAFHSVSIPNPTIERKSLLFGSCYGIGMPPIRRSWIRNLLHASATAVVGG